ncbi:hypothetical protein [Rhodanobacter hydrolyticus]|uniref:DUF1795 domain-containing protein n=1 Tax=Rhodanobacter hydrolyticus TaxID=2250595 RepID=A0ABW8J2Y9_9GAMM
MPIHQRCSILLLFLAVSGMALADGDVSYAPPYCNFSVTVPGPAHVEDHVAPDGKHALQAVTNANEPPLFIAQCTTSEDGSAPPNLKERMKSLVGAAQSFGVRSIQTTTFKDERGEWAKGTGSVIVGGHLIHVTVMNVTGKSSLLYLMGGTETGEDQKRFDHMVKTVMVKAAK